MEVCPHRPFGPQYNSPVLGIIVISNMKARINHYISKGDFEQNSI